MRTTWEFEDDKRWKDARSGIGGTGTASTLPMTDEERAKVAKKSPVGFISHPPKRKRSK